MAQNHNARIDMRTTVGKRQQEICQILLEMGCTHQLWTLDYIRETVCDNHASVYISVGEIVECMNIIRMTFGLPQIYYQMTEQERVCDNGVWEWDYSYPSE